MEPPNGQTEKTFYDKGKVFYSNYCFSCHGEDKNGQEPEYPLLIGLQERMERMQFLKKIKNRGGKMLAFGSILSGKEDAIMDLFI